MFKNGSSGPVAGRRGLLSLALLAALAAQAAADSPPVIATAGPAAATADKGYPTVRFDYGFVPFDRSCSRLTESEVPKEQIEELLARLESFQAYWDREGPPLLATMIAATGQPFRQREIIATMSLCDFPSMSHPLLINMRRFMDSGPQDPPRSMPMFAALVFHELLHIYVSDRLESSPLREKYKDEPGSVKSHMHLMALMKKVYLELGRQEVLEEIIAKDQKPGRPIYARSWQIVNELEGYQPFVDELKQ